jgi:hypothetical protein
MQIVKENIGLNRYKERVKKGVWNAFPRLETVPLHHLNRKFLIEGDSMSGKS